MLHSRTLRPSRFACAFVRRTVDAEGVRSRQRKTVKCKRDATGVRLIMHGKRPPRWERCVVPTTPPKRHRRTETSGYPSYSRVPAELSSVSPAAECHWAPASCSTLPTATATHSATRHHSSFRRRESCPGQQSECGKARPHARTQKADRYTHRSTQPLKPAAGSAA